MFKPIALVIIITCFYVNSENTEANMKDIGVPLVVFCPRKESRTLWKYHTCVLHNRTEAQNVKHPGHLQIFILLGEKKNPRKEHNRTVKS